MHPENTRPIPSLGPGFANDEVVKSIAVDITGATDDGILKEQVVVVFNQESRGELCKS